MIDKKISIDKNKKSFFQKFSDNAKQRSIRFRILLTFFLSCIVLTLIISFSTGILRKTITSIGDSYATNAMLDRYLTILTEAESAMESYVQYRTFESIDKYYTCIALLEDASSKLQDKPSAITVRQKEYIIRQLSKSFFVLSGNVIAARRSNSLVGINNNYNKTVLCYSFLREEILSLNILYFQSNAETYENTKMNTSIIINLSIILMVLFLIASLFVMYKSISRITFPLTQISSVALKVASRNFDVELFNSTRHDEIGNICRAFDQMIISIREYIDTIWQKAKKENELKAREIEMRALITESHFKALQEQIKPHFLFNTLNTGAGLALMEGADKTCYFLEQVADFLRYNIQHPGQDATIKDELGMLDNYIYIMQVRFGKRYEFIKDIDESILEYKMPNMILQPLVENCIKHGLKDITENGKIKIVVKQNLEAKEINVLISDNGHGFNPEIKEKIMNVYKTGQSIIINSDSVQQNEHISTGLVNVIARLKFYFKRDDVFDIISEQGKGTRFSIKIPYV